MEEMYLSDSKDKSLSKIIPRIKLVAFDFDGVFTDNSVYVFQDGTEAVMCSRGDGIGLSALIKHGVRTVIISTETNPIVSARSKKLNIPCIQSCKDKLAELKRIVKEIDCTLDETAFIGNDINDSDCLSNVALPVVPFDAHPDVIPLALYRTRACGGHGAVREVCDIFCRILDGKQSSN